MFRKILKTLFLIFVSINSFAQSITINADKENVCKNATVQFTAIITGGTGPYKYTWSFDDGSTKEIQNNIAAATSSTTHKFENGGGYFVKVEFTDASSNYDYDIIKIQSSLTPNFQGTNVDVTDSICPKSQVNLLGKTATTIWNYTLPSKIEENTPEIVSNSNTYTNTHNFKSYSKVDAMTGATNINSVGINIEHSNLSNLEIKLTCPQDAATIILKNFGGEDKYLGEPIDAEGSEDYGVGYDYFWTNTASGTINDATTTGTTLLSGNYEPDEAFSNLSGCYVNGEWKITITDNQANDNGYMFSTELLVNTLFVSDTWQFSNIYSSGTWNGIAVSGTLNGSASANPPYAGDNEYVFEIRDDFSCFQDTSVFVKVEEATISANPIVGNFPLEVNFTQETTWATQFEWNFDFEENISTEENPTFTYTTDTIYNVVFIAKSNTGCTDTSTVQITVTIPKSNLDDPPNVFSPNDDGINDVFFVSTDALEQIEGHVYTRWGVKVCEWHTVDEAKEGWDGTLNNNGGIKAAPGVYFYIIKAVGYDKQEYDIKGTLHLFK